MTTLKAPPHSPRRWLELQVIREKDGRNQASLARDAGYTRQYISALELGTRKPTPEVIARLSRVLNVPKSVIEPRYDVGDAA